MDEYNFQKEEEKFNPIDEMCIKVVNIYKNIINLNLNITGISEDLIRPDIHKQIDYNLVEYCRSAISLEKAKTQKIKKLNDDTMNFKEEVEIILTSVDERGDAEFYDIIKLGEDHMSKYLKVMFGNKGANFEYKIDEENVF